MDSLDWAKQFVVFSLSRLDLNMLRFNVSEISLLTDEDMQMIVNYVRNGMEIMFEEDVITAVSVVLEDKKGGTDETPPRTA
jgi:hypothetical protein